MMKFLILFVTLLQFVIINQSESKATIPTPPKPNDYARLARFLIHYSDYVSIATLSINEKIKGYPFVSLISLADGPMTNGTGVPYMYIAEIDYLTADMEKDPRVTIMVSLVQSDYCTKKNYDPEDPRCARLMISGLAVRVDKNSEEYSFARSSLFGRHPVMSTWPENHGFYVLKIDIKRISLFSYFGGATEIDAKDYFNVNSNEIIGNNSKYLKYILKPEDILPNVIAV